MSVDIPLAPCWLCGHRVLCHIRSCVECGCLAHYARPEGAP